MLTAACSGSGVDKAGGTQTPQPVVLTLADHEQNPNDVQLWIDEVQRRSGGSLRIQVTNRWRDQEFAYDKATIADVQAGKVQLAKVNARVYDTVGVDSFQALVAPFLIDNHPLQRRVPGKATSWARCSPAPTNLAWSAWRSCRPGCANRLASRVRWSRPRTTEAPASAPAEAGRRGDVRGPLAPPPSRRFPGCAAVIWTASSWTSA